MANYDDHSGGEPDRGEDPRRATCRYHATTALTVLGIWVAILAVSWMLSPRSLAHFMWGTLLPLLAATVVAIGALLLWRAHVHGHIAEFRRAVAERVILLRARFLVARSRIRDLGSRGTQQDRNDTGRAKSHTD